ncbi:hypothetical protein [Vibrio alginolyticus]|uniref:DNA polymerase III subunit beta family protein n=1 Tax=Vibrio alginolyticus TaxID=663 RepID=UPI0006CA8B18|nr:hypothetical protein [Vibrio alginolyticus]KPM97538.1 hypothetical protein AOG25_13785 [Vibrio alginolyticus]CAH7195170.1 DNA polymerase III beta subunit [Vibrio chagasii]CAH7362838.1 DNA polymerase III beta subunit [Vibrio chagasii]
MKISIKVSLLRALLKKVDDSVKSSAQKNPQYSNILISCSRDSAYLAGVNTESTVQVIIPSDEIDEFEDGSICAPMKKLTQIMAKYDTDSIVTITKLDEFSAQVKQGRSRQKLSCIQAREFAYSPNLENPKSVVELVRKDFASALNHVATVTNKFTTDDRLKGVSLKASTHSFRLASSDGHRVAKTDFSGCFEAEFNRLIPHESATAIAKLASTVKSEMIVLGVTDNHCVVSIDGVTLRTKLINDKPIDYDKFIVENGSSVFVNRDELATSVNLTLPILLDGKFPKIALTVSDSTVGVKAEDQNGVDHMYTEVDCNYDGAPFEIGINPLYLRSAIEAISEATIKLIYDPSQSAVISVIGKNSCSTSHHIMPIKL